MPQLDLLQTYLLVVNVCSLIIGALGSRIATGVLIAFSLMGGGPAILLASFAFDRRTRKDNVAHRFFAAWSTAAWALALVNIYGWHRFDPQRLVLSIGQDHTPLVVYLVVVNIATLVLFCVDKARAAKGAWRIREGVLLGLVLAGGSVGGLLGMLAAHHKVRTTYFRLGIPLALALHVALVAYLMQAGIA